MRTPQSRGSAIEVRTPRLLLHRWRPSDAPEACEVMESNDAYLRRFIPMPTTPRTLEEMLAFAVKHGSDFDADRHYRYVARDAGGALVGEVMLLDREENGGREVGYWIAKEHSRRGYATEGAAAMVRLAFDLDGVDEVHLGCSPRNVGSVNIARRLGFEHRCTIEHERPISPDDRESMLWVLRRAAFAARAPMELTAFDSLGKQLLPI